MTDFKFSICYFTYRPGGFDLLAHALTHQTYKNYELIVIDDYPNRNLKTWLEGQGIPVTYYGPMKEKNFKGTSYNQCNVLNTALIHATGDLFVVYTDYTWIEPDSLEKWNKFFNDNGLQCMASACGKEYNYNGIIHVDDISVFESPFNGCSEKLTLYHLWIPTKFELFYTVIPTKYLLDINGFDERTDIYCIFLYESIVAQAELNDMKLMVDNNHFCHIVNHRNWSMGNYKWWQVERTGISRPLFSPVWEKRSPNVFDIKELRSKCVV